MKRVVITGGAGQIAYSLAFAIARGELFGKNERFELHLLDIPECEQALHGVQFELEDCAFPNLERIKVGTNPEELFEGADVIFLVGAFPRGPGMERRDLLHKNAEIFQKHGKALSETAKKNVKVLVVGNPCNTNCLIALHNAKNIDPSQFQAMTRLDHNRALHQIAQKLHIPVSTVHNVIIWGNHSTTQVPDLFHVDIYGKKITQHTFSEDWIWNEFAPRVQNRGAEIIKVRGKSSAASAASSGLDVLRDWCLPTIEGRFYSTAIYSKHNPYSIDQDLVFSFPCNTDTNGHVHIVPGLTWNSEIERRIRISEKELQDERDMVRQYLRG